MFFTRSLFIAMFFAAGLQQLHSQDAAMELRRISETYQEAVNLSATAEVHTHRTANDLQGTLLGTGTFCKSANGYYSKFMNDELVSNKNCALLIDHSSRVITYFDKGKARKRQSQLEIPSVDSLIKRNDSVVYKGIQSNNRFFIFYSGGGPVQRIELYTDVTTNFITKIVYYYAPAPDEDDYEVYKVVVNYRDYSTKKPDEQFFSEKRFVDQKGDRITPAAAYKNYKLIKA